MVCSFQGWNDAGDAASTATAFLGQALGAERFAQVDTEEFYDFQANRPHVQIDETQARVISWPSVEMLEARAPRAPRDLVIVQGAEPSMRWRSFSALIVDLAEALDVQLVVTLGGLLADVPHSQPVAMTGFASDPAMIERLGLKASQLRGTHRDRGRAARLAARKRAFRRRAFGRACRTMWRPRRAPRPRSRCCASSS